MEMEVVVPLQNIDFDFNRVRSSPFGEYYFSAPTSPKQVSGFYRDFDEFLNGDDNKTVGSSAAAVPFEWEEKPGVPKSSQKNTDYEDNFAFDVSKEMEKTSLSADELFDGGVIRPLKPPPAATAENKYYSTQKSIIMSPRSHTSPISHDKNVIRGAFSPRQRERGRERVSSLPSSTSGHRVTRSLSPLRVSDYLFEEEEHQLQQNLKQSSMVSKPSSTPTTTTAFWCSSSKGYTKWSFKDLFLFRSASEGRATDKYPSKKYANLFKKQDDVKHSSFRAIERPGSGSRSRRRSVSAHELHYTINRAVSEDLKRKTFLPYKQGILGRLAFNPALNAIANGFGFSRK